jgi:hypothetical protein
MWNAEITLEIGTGVITYDTNGSPQEATTPLIVKGFLRPALERTVIKTSDRTNTLNENAILLVGRLTDPPIIDLSKVARTEPCVVILEGQVGRMLINYDVDTPVLYRKKYIPKLGLVISGYFYTT